MNIPRRILIVDDDIAASRLLELGLERSGRYHVRVENHSPQAVRTARSFQPDMVILDVVMPELDGGEVAAEFKQEADLKNLPILFLTSLVSEKDAVDETACQRAVRYLAKPAHVDRVIGYIECLLTGTPPPACAEDQSPTLASAE